MLKQQHQLFVGLLAAADGIVVVCACFGAWAVRYGVLDHAWWPNSWEEYPKEALVLYMVPVMLLVLRWFGLYRPRRDRSVLGETGELFKAAAAGMLVLVTLAYVFESNLLFAANKGGVTAWKPISWRGIRLDAGRVQLGALAVLLPTLLAIERATFRHALRFLRRKGWNQRHVAVIGCGRLGQIVGRTLERNSWTGLRVAYYISHQESTRRRSCLGKPVLGGLGELDAIMSSRKPDAVYIALPSSRGDLLAGLLDRLDKYPLDVRIVPDHNPRRLPQSMVIGELDGMPVLSVRECPTSGLGGVTKRALDIGGALIALAIFAVPMIIIALLVRLGGKGGGPVIFKQRRVSIGGQVFDIYKFRTMYHVEEEAGEGDPLRPRLATWTARNDPRITPIGRWLRRTSLDELPQLFNVLTGEMSLVGPRPERPELIERFREDWRGYMLRQHVKAGMTGWAQVNGLRGQTSLRKRLQYDLFYVKNWSLGLDLKILVLTLVRGFVHKNAH